MARQFRVRADFYSPELKSQYVTGLTYTIRDGNSDLAKLADNWAEEGRIELLDFPVTSEMAGRGEASPASAGGFWQKVKETLWP